MTFNLSRLDDMLSIYAAKAVALARSEADKRGEVLPPCAEQLAKHRGECQAWATHDSFFIWRKPLSNSFDELRKFVLRGTPAHVTGPVRDWATLHTATYTKAVQYLGRMHYPPLPDLLPPDGRTCWWQLMAILHECDLQRGMAYQHFTEEAAMTGVFQIANDLLMQAVALDFEVTRHLLQHPITRTTRGETRLDKNCEHTTVDGVTSLSLTAAAVLTTLVVDLACSQGELHRLADGFTADGNDTQAGSWFLRYLGLDQPPTAPLRADKRLVLQAIDTLQVLCEYDNPAMSALFALYVPCPDSRLTEHATITTRVATAATPESLGLLGLINGILAALAVAYEQPCEFLTAVYEHGALQGFQRVAGTAATEQPGLPWLPNTITQEEPTHELPGSVPGPQPENAGPAADAV